MLSRIEPTRRARILRKAAKVEPQAAEDAPTAEVVRLPVPLARTQRIDPRPARDQDAAFDAHLLGQEGEKRGLRAGPQLFDRARVAYTRTQWSGAQDRRAPVGGKARTRI